MPKPKRTYLEVVEKAAARLATDVVNGNLTSVVTDLLKLHNAEGFLVAVEMARQHPSSLKIFRHVLDRMKVIPSKTLRDLADLAEEDERP